MAFIYSNYNEFLRFLIHFWVLEIMSVSYARHFRKRKKISLFYNCSMPALFAFANRARQWYNTYNWVKWRLLRGQDKNMWKDRIRPGNPEKLGVTRAGRELNFAVAVQDGKDCSLLLYRKGMDEPELELGFTDDMRFGEICAMGLEGSAGAGI